MAVGEWQHRELDHGRTIDQAVEDPEFIAVNDILGVMEDDRLGRSPSIDLVRDQRIIKTIEAVGLRGRSVGLDLHGMHALIGDACNRGSGRWVVPIVTDENKSNYVNPRGPIFVTVGTAGNELYDLLDQYPFVATQFKRNGFL